MDLIKARLPVLLFLGSIFLAMACTSIGLAFSEKEKPKYRVCVKSCDFQNEASRHLACRARCKLTKNDEEDPHSRRPYGPEEAEEEEQGRHHPRDPEERARGREEQEKKKREEERRRHEQQQKEREQEQQQKQKQQEEEEEKQKKEQNPYHLSSEKFQTRFQNENGEIRVLQRFNQLSEQLGSLLYYRIVEFLSKPKTLVLPHHSDAEYLIVITGGRGILVVVFENNNFYLNVEQYDVLRVPAGAISYVINLDNNRNLRLIKLALPVNSPGQFENFYPSGNHIPKSYYSAFSERTLQATFNEEYNEIKRILFREQKHEQSSDEGAIVKLSKEQLRSLIQRAQSSRGELPSYLAPFNLRKLEPRYSNDHGALLEAHPHYFQLLQDLGIGVSYLQLNEGSLFLPHYNTRAIVLAYVDAGQGHLEIASPYEANRGPEEESESEEGSKSDPEKEEEQQQPEEGQEKEKEQREGQVNRFAAELNKGDLFVLPAGYPVAITASDDRNLKLIKFILNAPYNTRNFLGGQKDNIINQIDPEVKEAAFEGSGQEVKKLLANQQESYFVESQNQPSEEGGSKRKGNKVAWSSILKAFI